MTNPSDPPPRRRPPWWPDNEQWPPEHGPPWAYGWHRPWGRGGRPYAYRYRWPFGCALVLLVLFVTGALSIGVWAVGALTGFVPAHPVIRAVGVLIVVLVVIGVVAAGRAVRRMTSPIDDLVAASERIERGDYAARVAEYGSPQIRTLSRAFNKMTSRLADQDARRRTFLADVAHELRTPLSVIQAQLEAIEDGVYPADKDHLAPIHEQTLALEKLVEDLRTVALADAGSLTLDPRPTDLGALIEDSVASFMPQATAARVALSSSVAPDLPLVPLDAGRIRQVLANLLGNALRHTPASGWVKVTAAVEPGPPRAVAVEVADNGSGIPVELLPHVFERFAKAPGTTGSGLGLAIARDLVEAHGGRISAASPAGQGTTIRFTLLLKE